MGTWKAWKHWGHLGVLVPVSRELCPVPDPRLQVQALGRSVCFLCLFFQKQEDSDMLQEQNVIK